MSLDLTEAIELGAKALWDFAIDGDHAESGIDTWDEGGEEEKKTVRDGIRAVLEAAAPLLEKALREQIAAEIEARRDRLATDDVWENEGRAYLDEAASIARGGAR